MKKRLLVPFLLLLLFQACGSVQTVSEKTEAILRLRAKVEAFDFTFEARTAQSMRFNVVHLSPDYTLKVTKDSLIANLPFYGQAYTAPMSSTEGGIQFTSTKFDRKLTLGKRSGNWKITFKTLDTRNPLTLYLDIWENGSAHLTVNDPDRQVISFDGALTD